MVDIQSKEVIDKIGDELKVQPALAVPRTLAKDIQLVYAVNLNKISDEAAEGNAINAASGNVLVSSADRDTFITGATLSVIKDASSTSVSSAINVMMPNGVTIPIVRIVGFTTTAQNGTSEFTFQHPIRIQRGSTVTVGNSAAVANITARATILFYTRDPQ
jgi:hypothetical protein